MELCPIRVNSNRSSSTLHFIEVGDRVWPVRERERGFAVALHFAICGADIRLGRRHTSRVFPNVVAVRSKTILRRIKSFTSPRTGTAFRGVGCVRQSNIGVMNV